MKPLKIKKSDNLKKELSKIKGGNTDNVDLTDPTNQGNQGNSGSQGVPGNSGCNLANALPPEEDDKD